MDFPGGNLKFASYNSTVMLSDVNKGYVLPLTYFGNVFNIAALEFVPVGGGSIIIDIVKPICADDKKWCTLTKQCEKNCFTKFESLTKRLEAFYACDASDKKLYCSSEKSCLNELKCPTSITKEACSPCSLFSLHK